MSKTGKLVFRFIMYIRYLLYARHGKGFGVHSPFLWKLMRDAFNTKGNYYALAKITKARKQLLNNNTVIIITDIGAGAGHSLNKEVKISTLYKRSSVNKKYGELLFRLVNYFSPETCIELGTSLGISSLYIALAKTQNKLYSLEACPARIEIAKRLHKKAGVKNIEILHGAFDKTLPVLLKKIDKLDFVFFDGNHKKEATLKYFALCKAIAHENSVFIFDDIYWSKAMYEAWQVIKSDADITFSVDIYQFGLVFFDKKLSKQNFLIRY